MCNRDVPRPHRGLRLYPPDLVADIRRRFPSGDVGARRRLPYRRRWRSRRHVGGDEYSYIPAGHHRLKAVNSETTGFDTQASD